MQEEIFDIAGIGIGPFNLGLAALCQPINELKTILIDNNDTFDWHGGMMIPGATLQVSYLADLVTLVDPSSKFSYLSFLRAHNRLFQFGIHESLYITRIEYNRYCNWVSKQLKGLVFGHHVHAINYLSEKNCFVINTINKKTQREKIILAKDLVIGVGAKPYMPCNILHNTNTAVFHSSKYLHNIKKVKAAKNITIIGSGQSAAEIFNDLLILKDGKKYQLHWYTRAKRFFPMEMGKFNYEFATPDYIRYFFGLHKDQKSDTLLNQVSLYKGINMELINAIHDKLYEIYLNKGKVPVEITANTSLDGIQFTENDEIVLELTQVEQRKKFFRKTDCVILATGYKPYIPDFLDGIRNIIAFDDNDQYWVSEHYSIDTLGGRIFVQNAEMHSHGFNAPDLSLGPYRNAVIINAIMKKNVYPIDTNITFQKFGIEEKW